MDSDRFVNDTDLVNRAFRAIKARGINSEPTYLQIEAANSLLSVGLSEDNLTEDYIKAYIKGGDYKNTAIEFAKLDSDRFVNDTDLVEFYSAGGSKRKALLLSLQLGDFNKEKVIDLSVSVYKTREVFFQETLLYTEDKKIQ